MALDSKAIGLLIVGLIIGAAIGYGAVALTGTSGGQASGQSGEKTVTYKIGFTLPLSGQLSSIGKLWEKVATMAVDDLNKMMQSYHLPYRFDAVILDDGTTEEKALQNVQTFAQQGIKVVIGPAASSQVKAVKSFADSNHIVIISPSSTAPTLAIPNDYIFRNTGSDALQAKALATLVSHEGIKKVVVFYRDDEYGTAFADFFKKEFEALGGQAVLLSYASNLPDFASEVASLSSKVQSEGADAVVLISFDTDGANILSHAKDDPVLSKIRWFSGEGIHGASELLQPSLAEWLDSIDFMGTRPVFISNPLYEEFKKKFEELTGTDPPVFSEKLYDAVFLAGWAIVRAGTYDGEAIKNALPEVAKHYYGASGWCILDENGDRLFQDYSIWTIKKVGGEYKYVDIGTYSGGTLTFTESP
jgi:branched-chain amino acid transport system substrate-binding protein